MEEPYGLKGSQTRNLLGVLVKRNVKDITKMKRLIDHDPFTGISEYFHEDPNTGEWTIESVQNVEPELRAASDMRNDPEQSKQGIKDGFWHYAHFPNIVITKLLYEEGIDVYNPNDAPKLSKLIQKGGKYEYCRVTDGHHQLKG